MTQTPPEPTPPAAAPVDERVSKIEREQERQGGVLDRIVGMLDTSSDTTVTTADQPPAAAGLADMTAQMEAAIRKVNAESAKDAPKAPAPELAPREVGPRFRERVQRVMFGSEPKKP